MAPSPSSNGPTLAPSHPLMAELASLRQQLAQYQKSGHQSAIQLQGARLELSLAKEECHVLRETNDTLRSEVNVLRTHPLPPTQPPTSTALAELTLAHRRLSTKLDLTEQALGSCQLELASCKQEIGRLNKEREGDRAIINELRRGDEEKVEELEWERGERRKAEELKRLCDLALDNYKDLVRSLDPKAVPPSSPPTKPLIDPPTDLTVSDLDAPQPAPLSSATDGKAEATNKDASSGMSTSESISNLLVGQRGVNRLFEDFVSALTTKEKDIRRLSDRLEELEHTLSTVTDQLNTETSLRIEAESARETIMRDDASAAKVVERYMTFTQKTHATVHLHLDNLRSRSAATQHSLRKEIALLQARLAGETGRAERLRLALDEASENLSREVAGRRREVGLRLKMISNEEKRERKVEIWLDRVRRTREGVEGAVVEADILEGLLDEGVEAYTVDSPSGSTSVSKDKQRSWRGMGGILSGGRRRGISVSTNGNGKAEESSIARVLLAEELVDTLVKDLQVETERRMALESQRVDWLAKEAVEGREAGEDGEMENGVMFDLDQHENVDADGTSRRGSTTTPATGVSTNAGGEGTQAVEGEDDPTASTTAPDEETPPATLETPPPLDRPSPSVTSLQTVFQPLRARYDPLQSSLHSLSHSLADLRSSLPIGEYHDAPTASSSSTPTIPRKPILPFRRSPLSDPLLTSILDNLHETLEDARVDVEIAIADEDRVYRGFEALLGVGTGVVQSKDVLKDAREFVDFKTSSEGFTKLAAKVRDLEEDLSSVKANIHELDGMDLSSPPPSSVNVDVEVETPGSGGTGFFKPSISVWSSIILKSIDVTPPVTPSIEEGRRKLGSGMFGNVSNVGRSFSASVISAPRKVGGFAGGLYRPKKKGQVQEREVKGKEEEQRLVKDDDEVE